MRRTVRFDVIMIAVSSKCWIAAPMFVIEAAPNPGGSGASQHALGLVRARVTQLLDLLMLAPELQEAVLALEAADGVEPMAERALRAVAHAGSWFEQRGTRGS